METRKGNVIPVTFIPATPGWYFRYGKYDAPKDWEPILAWKEIQGRLHPVVPGGLAVGPQVIQMAEAPDPEASFPNSEILYRPDMKVE